MTTAGRPWPRDRTRGRVGRKQALPLLSSAVPDILVASDSDHVINELAAALSDTGTTVRSVRRGADVRPTVEAKAPDLVILDLQIGNMGGMAACLDLRLE